MSRIRSFSRPAPAVAFAVAMAIGASAYAAEPAEESLEEVIVTGTRRAGMSVEDSPAPVQVLAADALARTAAPDLMNSIANAIPSYNAQQVGGDMESQTLSAGLRALSPNHTLTLVNGKRRHITSNVGAYTGAAGADLSFIPSAAIDHVEVLTDGAAALYGSDAIAGVINIILKDDFHGGSLSAGYGGYTDGGGGTTNVAGSIGFGNEDAYFFLAGEVEDRQSAYRFSTVSYAQCWVNRAACEADELNNNGYMYSFTAGDEGMTKSARFPYVNAWLNPPELKRQVVSFNGGYKLDSGAELYTFGTFGKKKAESEENYRRPSQDGGYTNPVTGEVTHKYPYGFNPKEASDETDWSLGAGIAGETAGWSWDFGSVYGRDEMDVYTNDSMNFTLWNETGASPEDFYDGSFYASQWTTSLSASKDFEIGMAGPLTFAAGVEYREDEYGIGPGEPASYYGAGASSFPGYNPLFNTGDYSRSSYAGYVNFILNPVEKWLVDVAGRFEHFSDFGSKVVGKLTTRYDFTDAFAVRGTVSTGFRAPNLGEGFYSAIGVGPNSATPQLQSNSPAAAALGFGDGLKPEKSTNISLGLVLKPLPNLTATVDYYRITLKDRIGQGSFQYSVGQSDASLTGRTGGTPNAGLPDPGDTNGDGVPDDAYNAALGQALVDFGYLGAIDPAAPGGSLDPTARANLSVNLFNNALKTRTQGVDLVTNYRTPFGWGSVDWTVAANYNKLDVLDAKAAPAALGGATMYGAATLKAMETNSPKYRVNLSAGFNVGDFTLTLRESIYGSQYGLGGIGAYPASVTDTLDLIEVAGTTYYKQKIGTMALTGFDLAYKPTDSVTVSVGGDNLFNKYPDKIPSAILDYENSTFNNWNNTEYLTGSPIGYFGRRLYGRVSITF